ncbi:MAG: S-layer homology domain-containing protein [Oscillospiraceae bacterium]|nr:S-layer homology domain-containing protein [Oscillospiraceae bacterium]
MQAKSKKLLSTLLAVAMVLSLFAAMPLTAGAATASQLSDQIDSFDHGGAGTLSVSYSGNTVTVTGTVTGATNTLALNIDSGVTVVWEATYSGSHDSQLLTLTGSGAFEVATGGSLINNGNGNVIVSDGAGAAITVSGGTVKTDGNFAIGVNGTGSTVHVSGGSVSAQGIAIKAIDNIYSITVPNTIVRVSGGTVETTAVGESFAIAASEVYVSGSGTVKSLIGASILANKVDVSGGTVSTTVGMGILTLLGSTVHVSGGTVSATDGFAIYAVVDATVNVSGGTVSATGTGNAIYAFGDGSKVNVSGGTVNATGVGNAIVAFGNGSKVTVTDGTVSAAADGFAIKAVGNGSSVTVGGGQVSATNYVGIGALGTGSIVKIEDGHVSATTGVAVGANGGASSVTISGGHVSVTTGIAVGANGAGSSVTVTGGTVSAMTAAAIGANGAGSSVTVTGGFVFANGTDITGTGNVIVMTAGLPSIGGTAVVCAWDKPGAAVYAAGDKTDLTVNPATANASWDKSGTQDGISYANGANTGFFPISGITVNAAAPSITGSTTMTLTAGYAATSTGVYTITGTPAPTVTKTSGNTAITWNNTTKKLDIAAGLAAGAYSVVLTATSGTNTATLTFTLTVTASGGTPFPFIDVRTSDWFYNDVKTAWEQGLINGKSATIFAPNDNLTYAEAVKLAACMHQLYTTGSVTLTNGSPNWYDSYVTYAKNNGIINKDYNWNAPATRAGYMEIFVNAVPLSSINTIADGAIPDVPTMHPQAAAIYKLYRAGILQGVDAAHNCNPDSNIKRSEVAAILTRMMNENARISFSM